MRYEPKIGKELVLTAAVIVAKTRHLTEVTRSTIALAIVAVVLIALAATAAFCLYRGDYQVLQTLWAVVAAPLGCIIGYYFRGTGTNGKEDHPSTA
jgi:tellurite resistance protein TehA-like permease